MSFYSDDTRKRVAETIEKIEARTAAEVVVTVRNQAGQYRHVDLMLGAIAGFLTLLLLLFYPRPFAVKTMPLDVAVVGLFVGVASARSPLLRRWFSRRVYRQRQVLQAARAAFVEMGISRTRGRSGVLVFVSMLERDVCIVADVGVHMDLPVKVLQQAVMKDDVPAFLAALSALADPLCDGCPRQEDDVDELSNEMTIQ